VGHTINKAEYLFSPIKPEKEQEWREQFGGEEARKAKDEKAAKAAAKKAEKERKKAKKVTKTEDGAADTAKETQPLAADKVGQSVEAAEKGGQGEIPASGTAVEEVEKGVNQVSLQTS
jgi:methionyl-tRNA synthetase